MLPWVHVVQAIWHPLVPPLTAPGKPPLSSPPRPPSSPPGPAVAPGRPRWHTPGWSCAWPAHHPTGGDCMGARGGPSHQGGGPGGGRVPLSGWCIQGHRGAPHTASGAHGGSGERFGYGGSWQGLWVMHGPVGDACAARSTHHAHPSAHVMAPAWPQHASRMPPAWCPQASRRVHSISRLRAAAEGASCGTQGTAQPKPSSGAPHARE